MFRVLITYFPSIMKLPFSIKRRDPDAACANIIFIFVMMYSSYSAMFFLFVYFSYKVELSHLMKD